MIKSPNTRIEPQTATTNSRGHLEIGGIDTTELAERFGTPLWIIDEATVKGAITACQKGLKDSDYPNWKVLYAGKAFLCLAMCHLIKQMDLGLDVVSYGELYTALKAEFPADLIYLHGNNKSQEEITKAISVDSKIVVDSHSELFMVAELARAANKIAEILLRVTPGVEPDTHHYIKTGQLDSKFGLPLDEIPKIAQLIKAKFENVKLIGIHAHIGSQSHSLDPYLEIVDIMADCYAELCSLGIDSLTQLDIGGGLGITYTDKDQATGLYEWSYAIGKRAKQCFNDKKISPPKLLVEPGRAIIGTAGVTLYRAGHAKDLPGNLSYLAVDGGMADNPRPITYQAEYTAVVANNMNAPKPQSPITLVGKYCESGDVLIEDVPISAGPGDLIAVFSTGAYNYSMSSNYNRTGRPACVLVNEGQADVIVERESADDLLAKDRVPNRLTRSTTKSPVN